MTTEQRLNRLETIAETTLLAIQQLASQQRDNQAATRGNIERHEQWLADHDAAIERHEQWLVDRDAAIERHEQWLADHDAAIARIDAQQDLNAQQIANLAAGILDLRNLVADYIQSRSQIE